jgi:hypothetical protein
LRDGESVLRGARDFGALSEHAVPDRTGKVATASRQLCGMSAGARVAPDFVIEATRKENLFFRISVEVLMNRI